MKLNVQLLPGAKFGVVFDGLIKTCERHLETLSEVTEAIRRSYPNYFVAFEMPQNKITLRSIRTNRLHAEITQEA